ncbi:hypothetical protein P0136_00445 [Lentisphaerota bacterium ZTH]|nr:hypothetical protein JYG24_08410 [Lentisphaerota bacterium]WET06483.1 hypothetical protein P0136_00445 [Lentisphaerota bacterium ZTH]
MKNKFRLLLLFTLMLSTGTVFAQTSPKKTTVPTAARKPSAKAIPKGQEFKCFVQTSLSYSFSEQLAYIPPTETPVLPIVSKVYATQLFDVYVFFQNFAIKDNKTNVTFDVKVTGPRGRHFFGRKNLEGLVISQKINAPNHVHLSPNIFRISFNTSDPKGTYRINIKATDHISGQETKTFTRITLLGGPPMFYKAVNFTPREIGEFMCYYYLNPKPERLVPVFLGFCKICTDLRDEYPDFNHMALMAFFYRAFSMNKFLLPALTNSAKDLPFSEKQHAVFLMHWMDTPYRPRLIAAMGPDAMQYDRTLDSCHNPFIIKQARSSVQLDILWSLFFASGEFEPVFKILATMQLMETGLKPEELKRLKGVAPGTRSRIRDWIVGHSAEWSLKVNCRRHKLLRYYCEAVFADPETPPFIKYRLSKVLGIKYKMPSKHFPGSKPSLNVNIRKADFRKTLSLNRDQDKK